MKSMVEFLKRNRENRIEAMKSIQTISLWQIAVGVLLLGFFPISHPPPTEMSHQPNQPNGRKQNGVRALRILISS